MGFRLANVEGRAVLVSGTDYHDLEALSAGALGPDPMDALALADAVRGFADGLGSATPTGSLDDVVIGCPVPRPRDVFGIGLNYRDHAAETGRDQPTSPLVFTKFPSCLCGPDTTIELRSDAVDYEAELVVVIGTGGKDIAEADAWDHVVGLTMGQDVSDRAMQFAGSPAQFGLGKSFDTFGPIGPAVVSLDEIGDVDELRVRCSVNGQQRQDGSVRDLIFSIPRLIHHLSHVTTLSTGDLIFTGTPAGVGAPTGDLLVDGDVVVTTICSESATLGTMTNRCVRVSDHV
ncbi:fumarylacetoacetate hydrolase family protein [Ilumatobacter sp.]|uniref:fumarylacetoacetate hydrolase family protein n=1 Tax=Ilumatobacter sp. TaxID=1967498 RepID=UPI003B52CE0D